MQTKSHMLAKPAAETEARVATFRRVEALAEHLQESAGQSGRARPKQRSV